MGVIPVLTGCWFPKERGKDDETWVEMRRAGSRQFTWGIMPRAEVTQSHVSPGNGLMGLPVLTRVLLPAWTPLPWTETLG